MCDTFGILLIVLMSFEYLHISVLKLEYKGYAILSAISNTKSDNIITMKNNIILIKISLLFIFY